MALMLTSQCSAMEPPHKKQKKHDHQTAVVELTQTYDIPTLQGFANSLKDTERQLVQDIDNTKYLLILPCVEERACHLLITDPKNILPDIQQDLITIEQALFVKKLGLKHFTNRQITGKNLTTRSYHNTFRKIAFKASKKIEDYTEERTLKEGDLFLAQATNDPEEIINAIKAKINLIQDRIDEIKTYKKIARKAIEEGL